MEGARATKKEFYVDSIKNESQNYDFLTYKNKLIEDNYKVIDKNEYKIG